MVTPVGIPHLHAGDPHLDVTGRPRETGLQEEDAEWILRIPRPDRESAWKDRIRDEGSPLGHQEENHDPLTPGEETSDRSRHNGGSLYRRSLMTGTEEVRKGHQMPGEGHQWSSEDHQRSEGQSLQKRKVRVHLQGRNQIPVTLLHLSQEERRMTHRETVGNRTEDRRWSLPNL